MAYTCVPGPLIARRRSTSNRRRDATLDLRLRFCMKASIAVRNVASSPIAQILAVIILFSKNKLRTLHV